MFPHHENERAQAVAVGHEFARHWVHNGWVTVGRREDVQVTGQLHLAHRPVGAERRPRLPAAGAAVPLPVAHRGDPGDHHRRRGRAGPPRRDGPPVRGRGPPGRRARHRSGGVRPRGRRPPRSTPRRWSPFRARWTTISTLPGHWPSCSTWCARPTAAADSGATTAAARSGRTAALLAAALGLRFATGEDGQWIRRPRSWCDAGTRRGRHVAGTRPTRCVVSWRLRGGWSRTGPTGTRIRRQ